MTQDKLLCIMARVGVSHVFLDYLTISFSGFAFCFGNEQCSLELIELKCKVKDNDTGLTAFTFLVLRHICFLTYFLNNNLSQEGVRAYCILVFNLPFAPSLYQLSLLPLFAIISIFLFFPRTDLILYLFTSSLVYRLVHRN